MQRTIFIDSDMAKAAVGRQGSLLLSAGATVANVGPVRPRWLLEEGGMRIGGQVPRPTTAFDIARRLVAWSHPSVARCRVERAAVAARGRSRCVVVAFSPSCRRAGAGGRDWWQWESGVPTWRRMDFTSLHRCVIPMDIERVRTRLTGFHPVWITV